DLDNWTFLTGYDFEDIQKLSVDSFKSPVDPPLPDDDQVGHGTRFFLVDPDGNVHKNYMGTESEAMDKLAEDLEKLVGRSEERRVGKEGSARAEGTAQR